MACGMPFAGMFVRDLICGRLASGWYTPGGGFRCDDVVCHVAEIDASFGVARPWSSYELPQEGGHGLGKKMMACTARGDLDMQVREDFDPFCRVPVGCLMLGLMLQEIPDRSGSRVVF